MFDCEKCIKKDVCSITTVCNEVISDITLQQDYQRIKNLGIVTNFECTHFLATPPKILKGEK